MMGIAGCRSTSRVSPARMRCTPQLMAHATDGSVETRTDFLCGCCGETFNWRALTAHLNQTGAHLRPPCWHVALLPMTDRPNRSCRQIERENRGRVHPYARSASSTASSPTSYRQQDPVWSSATVDPPVTQSAQFSCGTGFGSPPPFSPGGLLTDLAVTSSLDTLQTWT